MTPLQGAERPAGSCAKRPSAGLAGGWPGLPNLAAGLTMAMSWQARTTILRDPGAHAECGRAPAGREPMEGSGDLTAAQQGLVVPSRQASAAHQQ